MAKMAAAEATRPRPPLMRIADLEPDQRKLVEAAIRARGRAHAPYSDFKVGAAALDTELRQHRGCNVEISSYGLTMCAERVALFAARAAGSASVTALAVAGPGHGSQPTPPCGACRQVIWDLAGDIPVLMATLDGHVEVWHASELLPAAFGPDHLEGSTTSEDEP